MAKATTSKGARKTTARKSPAAKATSRKTPAKARSSRSQGEGMSAADALVKLIESPLVAELLTVGATAALAALAETGFKRSTDGRRSSKAFKAAGKAAAAAMGRRLSTEIDEIRSAAKRARENEAG